jgi:hypothetical protein
MINFAARASIAGINAFFAVSRAALTESAFKLSNSWSTVKEFAPAS